MSTTTLPNEATFAITVVVHYRHVDGLPGIARMKDNLTQRIAQAVDDGLLKLDPPIQFFGWNFGVLDLAGP